MELTRSLVEKKAQEHRKVEPLYTTEQDHVEMLSEAFKGEEYGWRDVEWVVQWYFRRYLGMYPGDERRATEESVRENDFGAVKDVLGSVVEQRLVAEQLNRLTTLVGVDIPVASGFLISMFPDQYLVVGDREWRTLREANKIEQSYPDTLTIDDYHRYHEIYRDLADRFNVDAWTLYRALWRLGDNT